jgi:hypothetical protein
MRIKRKHAQVIIYSSLIIAIVFVSTLVGYSIYMQWKKDAFASKYRNSIYKLTAELFKNDIILSNIDVKMDENSTHSQVPLIEGRIRNNTNKTITSVLVEVAFLAPDGRALYRGWFHPLGERRFGSSVFSPSGQKTRNVLSPGEGITFRYLLRNCPREVVREISKKSEFAKNNEDDTINLFCSIEGLKVL